MTNKERMEELIFVFTDADKRATMTDKELEKCPTLDEIYEAMNEK